MVAHVFSVYQSLIVNHLYFFNMDFKSKNVNSHKVACFVIGKQNIIDIGEVSFYFNYQEYMIHVMLLLSGHL